MKKRNIITYLLSITMVFTACSNEEDKMISSEGSSILNSSNLVYELKDGSYKKEGFGHNGKITIETLIEDNEIKDIKILDSKETPGIGQKAIDLTIDSIKKNQSTNIDDITGATISSKSIKKLVNDSLLDAGMDKEQLDNMEEINIFANQDIKDQYDVVIVGAGGAGLSAAITAKQKGADVVVFEKNGYVGGNTMVSGGGINIAYSKLQEENGIEDSTELFIEDTMKGGDEINDRKLVETMVNKSLDAYNWLVDEIGVKFVQDRIQQFGGHSVARAHIPENNTGYSLTEPLLNKCKDLEIPVILEHEVIEITESDGKAKNVVLVFGDERKEIKANKGVIIASGGFAANIDMRKKYNEQYADYATTALLSSQGDGIEMVEKMGADLVDMEHIQVYPTCNPLTGIISYVANSRFDGALLFNKEGKRFTNEGGRRDVISNDILAQTDKLAYLVWSSEIENVGNMTKVHENEFNDLLDKKLIVKADSLEEAAKFFGIDSNSLQENIRAWNELVVNEQVDEFEKTGAKKQIANGPFYIQKVTPSTHHTMGGIKVNEKAQVLNKDGEVINGLYAAGEVVGGIHGTNRLGGNAITDCIVFGTIAGENIVE